MAEPSLGASSLLMMGIRRDQPRARGAGVRLRAGRPGDPLVPFAPPRAGTSLPRESLQDLMQTKRTVDRAVAEARQARPGPSAGAGGRRPAATAASSPVDRFVDIAGQCLHFRAYFTEAVVESPHEAYRIRPVVVKYHLEDDTIELFESHLRNDGMSSFKKFLNRIRVDGVAVETLAVGGTFTAFGRTYKIVECDEFTRNFYAERGEPQLPNEDTPEDKFAASLRAEQVRKAATGVKMNAMKRYMENTLGNARPKRDTLGRFLQYDKLVLRFQGVWDEAKEVGEFGAKHLLNIAFHVVSNEVEIRLVGVHGRSEPPRKFLKKQRLPKRHIVYDDRQASCEDDLDDDDYHTLDDMRVGETVNVFGREVLLYDCDSFTQEWYAENLGLDQKANASVVEEPQVSVQEVVPPPPTGFGDDDDIDPASWKFIHPRRRRRNLKEFQQRSSTTLKYWAHLLSERPTDSGREFRITWYLEDSTVAIYEIPKRNSGIVAGQFQKRTKMLNPETGRSFEASDFYVGAVVTLKAHRFEIDTADDFTMRHMEASTSLWPMSSFEFVMTTLKHKITDQSRSLRKMFRKFDEDHSGNISFTEFRRMLYHYGMSMSKAEVTTIFRVFDTDKSGFFDYNEFIAAFTDRNEVGGAAGGAARVNVEQSAVRAALAEDKGAAAAFVAEAERRDRDLTRVAATDLLIGQVARSLQGAGGGRVGRIFRRLDENKDNTLDREEFRLAMGDSPGGLQLSPAQVDALIDRFFDPSSDVVSVSEFRRTIERYANVAQRTQ